MAYPTTPYALNRDGIAVLLTGAACHTITPRIYYRGKTHSFGLLAYEVNGGTGPTNIEDATVSLTGNSFDGMAPFANSWAAKHDQYTLTDPRHTGEKLDMIEWWDATTPGHAMTMTVTTVSGSATLTVPSTRRLTIGQAITGTGIPTGAKIADFLNTSATPGLVTSVLLTHQCTASASVEATLTGANLIAQMPLRDFALFSPALPASIS